MSPTVNAKRSRQDWSDADPQPHAAAGSLKPITDLDEIPQLNQDEGALRFSFDLEEDDGLLSLGDACDASLSSPPFPPLDNADVSVLQREFESTSQCETGQQEKQIQRKLDTVRWMIKRLKPLLQDNVIRPETIRYLPPERIWMSPRKVPYLRGELLLAPKDITSVKTVYALLSLRNSDLVVPREGIATFWAGRSTSTDCGNRADIPKQDAPPSKIQRKGKPRGRYKKIEKIEFPRRCVEALAEIDLIPKELLSKDDNGIESHNPPTNTTSARGRYTCNVCGNAAEGHQCLCVKVPRDLLEKAVKLHPQLVPNDWQLLLKNHLKPRDEDWERERVVESWKWSVENPPKDMPEEVLNLLRELISRSNEVATTSKGTDQLDVDSKTDHVHV